MTIGEKDYKPLGSIAQRARLDMIIDMSLCKELALKWCVKNNYILGNYAGKRKWEVRNDNR